MITPFIPTRKTNTPYQVLTHRLLGTLRRCGSKREKKTKMRDESHEQRVNYTKKKRKEEEEEKRKLADSRVPLLLEKVSDEQKVPAQITA